MQNPQQAYVVIILALMKRLGVESVEVTHEEGREVLEDALTSNRPVLSVRWSDENSLVAELVDRAEGE
jgi:hypothetical protein